MDAEDGVLLLRYDDPPPMGVHWATPGGGIEPGESERDAAARELREETGWGEGAASVAEELGRTCREIVRRAGPVTQHEVHFAVRLPDSARPLCDAGHAVDEISGWRWWPRAELGDALASGTVRIWPAELARLLDRLDAAAPSTTDTPPTRRGGAVVPCSP